MKRIFSRKRIVFLAVLAVAAIGAVAAYGYFSTTGSGSGSATVGDSTPITLNSDPVSGLVPAGPDVPVRVFFTNTGPGAQYVAHIFGTVADNGGCLGSWFQVDTIDYLANFQPGDSGSILTDMRMIDSGSNQDVCKGKVMTINWTSN